MGNSKRERTMFGVGFMGITMVFLIIILMLRLDPPRSDVDIAQEACVAHEGLRRFYPGVPVYEPGSAAVSRWRAVCGDNTLVIGPWRLE